MAVTSIPEEHHFFRMLLVMRRAGAWVGFPNLDGAYARSTRATASGRLQSVKPCDMRTCLVSRRGGGISDLRNKFIGKALLGA
jgi:hypothetical protein